MSIKPGWLDCVEAVIMTEADCDKVSWVLKAFVRKHDWRWIRYKNPSERTTAWSSPALYMAKLWAQSAMSKGKAMAWNAPGDHYENLGNFAYEIATADDYLRYADFDHVWNLLTSSQSDEGQ